jgi:aldose sugar dehydrogenase
MKSWRLVPAFSAAAAVLCVSVVITAQAPVQPGAAPQTPGGGGGGRGPTPGSLLWTEKCAGCHGTATAPGRGPNLFAEAFLAREDAHIASAIKSGVPGTEMPPFGPGLTDLQIFQVILHLRTASATARPAPAFVANPDGAEVRSAKQAFRLELVADGLMTPWALAFLPDGRLLVTERDGRLRIVDRGRLSAAVSGVPTPHVQQDGGYFDVELHPDYARNRWIYLAYSEVHPAYVAPSVTPAPTPPSMTVIVRGRINEKHEWTDEQLIYRAPAELYTTSGAHYGCRMIFDRQNHLFFSIGERGNQPVAQDLRTPLGKIHRVNDDGSLPADNPFTKTGGAVPTIWSYGHRNPEGFAWDPVTGALWSSEHGPNTADEINIIDKGHNYGWAMAAKSGHPSMELSKPGMDDPIVYFAPTFAPAGIAFYTGARYPGWKNTSLFVGGLRGQALRRLEIKGRAVVGQEVVFNQYGRVRDIVQSPDGYFYVALQDPTGVPNPAGGNIPLSASTAGRIVRLVPM